MIIQVVKGGATISDGNAFLPYKGERVSLREFQCSEAEATAIHAYSGDPEVTRYLVWGPDTFEETKEFLAKKVEQQNHSPRLDYDLAVIERDSGRLIGGARLGIQSQDHRRGDIGYVLRRDQWGRGIGTEVGRLLLALGFKHLRLHRIEATCNPENVASCRLLEAIGMTREGRIRDHFHVNGSWRDSFLYAILADEWRQGGQVRRT